MAQDAADGHKENFHVKGKADVLGILPVIARLLLYFELIASHDIQSAIGALRKALTIYEAPYMYYNLAFCERHIDLQSAKRDIERCLELSGASTDDDHLELACRIYRDLGDPAYDDVLDRLREINPQKALLISMSND